MVAVYSHERIVLTKVPIVRTVVGDGKTALNCLQFSKNGSQIATGSVDGRVFVLDLGEVCWYNSDV